MPALLQTLRDTNRRLNSCLDTIAAQPGPEVITPERMNALLSDLLTAGAGLRAKAVPLVENDRELSHELTEYRRQVERLRDLLPSIHRALLAERTRIERQRSRLQSAAAWARASRQTL